MGKKSILGGLVRIYETSNHDLWSRLKVLRHLYDPPKQGHISEPTITGEACWYYMALLCIILLVVY